MKENKTNKIRNKNLLIVLCFVFIVICLSVCVYLPLSNAAFENHLKNVEHQKMQTTTVSLTHTLKQIASVAHYYATLNIYSAVKDSGYYSRNKLINQIDSSLIITNSIETLTIKNGDSYIGSKMNMYPDSSVKDPEVLNKKFYGFFENLGVYDVSNCGYQYNLYLKISAEPDTNIMNDVFIGVDTGKFANVVFPEESYRKQFLVDDTGRVIVSSDASLTNHVLKDIYSQNVFSPDSSEESRIIKTKQGKYIFTVSKLQELDLYIVNAVEMNAYSDYVFENICNELLFGLILFFGISLIAVFVFHIMYKPIKRIIDCVDTYQILVPDGKTDEIEYINSKFRILATENEELTQTVEDKIYELRKQQIMALQTQICPHFMYNTLDALNWIAYRELQKFDNPISNALNGTADVLQAGLDINTIFNTIQEEIEITQKYIYILGIRYESTFNFVWDVEPELLNCIILKMCMQPIIENTVVHAFDEVSKEAKITITIRREAENIKIVIADNGCGIDNDLLQEIRSNMNCFINPPNKCIGLRNVNRRLKLLYGESYGLELQSTSGEGTRCSFMVPYDNTYIPVIDNENLIGGKYETEENNN